jgi:hypothetical protein
MIYLALLWKYAFAMIKVWQYFIPSDHFKWHIACEESLEDKNMPIIGKH